MFSCGEGDYCWPPKLRCLWVVALSSGSQKQHSKLQLISIMSVPPLKVTEPRRVCQVLMNDDTDTKSMVQGCYKVVLYYEKPNDDEGHSWSLAGWIVESLARALLEYPLLAGRLQRREVGDHIGLEIVSNDSGIRLLEAQYQMGLSEFLDFNQREHLEAELMPWEEIDAHCPDFSPLSYVQVTCFECGGYTIGISCSLLLAEVMVVENFLNKWAQIHNTLRQNQYTNETPVFCHSHMENPESPPSSPYIINHTSTKHGIRSMVFKIKYGDANFSRGNLWRELAMLCVEKAEQKLDKKIMGSEFSLVVKESSEIIMVESCLKSGYNMNGLDLKNQIRSATWNDFGVNEVAFHDGNKPLRVSCWIGSVADGCVMAIPCPQRNACVVIVVSPPS